MTPAQSQLSLGDYLVREGFITQAQFNRALEGQRKTSRSIGRILVDMDLITESMRMIILQKQFGFKLIRLKDMEIEQLILSLIPFTFADKHKAVPITQEADRTLVIAMEDPSDILVLDMIKNQLGMNIKPCVASHEEIHEVLHQYGPQEQLAAAEEAVNIKDRIWYRFLRKCALPILIVLLFILLFTALSLDMWGVGKFLNRAFSEKIITKFDLSLYLVLGWTLWSIVLYWVNGLIFDTQEPEEEI
jgi:hypothetical protein